MKIEERFIRYTTFDTQSSEDSQTVPSTSKQLLFAKALKEEMEAEGVQNVVMDEQGYIYGTVPSTMDDTVSCGAMAAAHSKGCSIAKPKAAIGFIAHYDTSPDCSGKDVKARIIRNYDGNDIELSEGIWSTTQQFPELKEHIGEDIIVTDGTTLLGADDKAGIAEIMHAMTFLMQHPEIKHPEIRIAFNPDEEIGMGAHHFDVQRFNAEVAYTIDGGDLGELEYENFNAAVAHVSFKGRSVHPGYAMGKMLNAGRIAMEFASMMPQYETPETTTDYEGFFHLTGMEGSCEKAKLTYIIRDHDHKTFNARKAFIESVGKTINERYGENVCEVTVKNQYYNMLEKIEPVMHIIDTAKAAMLEAGVTPLVQPIRGGTDGAQLSFMGLPCPNLFTGAVNFHGPNEFVSIQVMEKAAQTIINICKRI